MGAQVFEIAGVQYMKVTPAKTLFRSNMVHEVVTRGDCFVVNLGTGSLTIMSNSLIEFADKAAVIESTAPTAVASPAAAKKERARLKQLRDEAKARELQRKSLNLLFDRMTAMFEEVHKS